VFIVEDDPIQRAQMREYLEEASIRVVEAAGGKLAISRMATERPDLFIVDLILPDLSGYDVCEHIRKNLPTKDVPILVVSVRLLPSYRAQAEEAGATAYLNKPFAKKEFIKMVRSLLPAEAAAG